MLASVGHVVVDSLASRFGIHMTATREGYLGQRHVTVGIDEMSLTLFKSSECFFFFIPSYAMVQRVHMFFIF
jgi:PTH1 family peptidyl-tRNA hydrolase